MVRWLALTVLFVPTLVNAADFDVPFLGQWEDASAPESLAQESPQVRAAALSRAFAAQRVHPGVALADLEFLQTPQGDVLRQVQTVGGVPVDGTSGVVQVRDGRVAYAHYRVTEPQEGVAEARINAEQARTVVQNRYAPEHVGEASLHWRRAGEALQLVWRVPMVVTSPVGDWAVDVDAVHGTYVTRTSLDVYAAHGEVVAPVERRCQGDAPQATALRYIKVNDNEFADAAGAFVTKEQASHAHVELTSPYIELRDMKKPLSGPWTLPLVESPAHNTLELENVAMSHADAYYALHEVRDWLAARSTLSERQRAWANRKVGVNVNQDGYCNAFYSTYQETLNFFPAGRGCMDSARSTQALFHEYGHALTFHSGAGDFDATQALGEGYGDVVATFVSGKGVVGDIKPNCDTVLRSCVNKLTFCKKGCDFKGWRHAYKSAQVVCGAWWDLRTRLMERYGDAHGADVASDLFVRHLPLVTGDMPDTYAPLIAADDDADGDVRNGTMHSCEINASYVAHFPDLRAELVPCVASRR